ncbi:MAG: peptidoglycan-binding protein [Spirulina sp.]
MFYPIGWLAPELPKPAPQILGSDRLSVLPSTHAASLWPRQGHRHGLAEAIHRPRWTPGRSPSKALPPGPVVPGSDQSTASASTAESTQAMVLRQGSQGDAVWAVQARLQRLGYDPGPLDGYFGPQTERAVRQFQQASSIAVDGVVGAITWRYLVPGRAIPLALNVPPAPAPPLAAAGVTSVLPPAAGALSTPLGLSPMVVLPEESPSQILGIVVIGLGLAGLVTHLGFRPDVALRPRQSSASAPSPPIHTPQPIYPVNPTPFHPAASDLSDSNRPNPAPSNPDPSDPAIPPIITPTHLPDFVYDLLQPYDRHQLEVLLQGRAAQGVAAKQELSAKAGQASQSQPMLAALLQRVGIFPEHNHRTGSPYTYMLLDDVGGCFRLCGNELWLTHIVHHWFQPDMAYTAMIRRIDAVGQVLDKEFTVALSRQQLAWVA